MKPKALILRTAGTNCDKETAFAFQTAGAVSFLYHINYIKEKNDFSDYQIICIPGGFSYGDDLGAGKILSLELALWMRDAIKKFIDKGGLILGICNGFQVLVKTGILPDLDFKQKVTLMNNDSGRFEDMWVYLESIVHGPRSIGDKVDRIWLKGLPQAIALPIAHGEGKFYADEEILDKIEKNNQVVLRYTFNPNGSVNNIAGITDITGRVLGLMPHPERFMFNHQWPFWQEEEPVPFGFKIFQNAVDYFK